MEIAGATTVLMKDGSFEPNELTVEKNTKVVFKNIGSQPHWPASNIHPTHGTYPEFDPKRGIAPGQEWSFDFVKIGSWSFHDHLFPAVLGKITVTN